MSAHLNLLARLFHGSTAEQIFSSESQMAEMVRVEIALTYALETAGVAPASTGDACALGSAGFPALEHTEAIARAAVQSGNLAIPFVKIFTEFVRVQAGDAADFIHFGATSQDLLDTALVLRLREFIKLTTGQIQSICVNLIAHIHHHRATLLPGRTWLQQGPPITFGLKAAQWLSAMLRDLERLSAARERVCILQFGGAVGTLASLGDRGPAVTRVLAGRLGLRVPDTPWHSQRDSLSELASVLAIIDGTLGKIARDLALMLQHEVAELQLITDEGVGGSSTMPHKRNPVSLAVVLAAAVRAPGLASTMLSAMVQEHERGLGGWHAEWETLPDLCRITSGSLANMESALRHLKVDTEAMRRNLDLLHGVTLAEAVSMRLSETLGRPEAHRILEKASRTALERKVDLITILREDTAVTAHLSVGVLQQVLDPASYLGSADIFIDQVLARANQILPSEDIDAIP